ncbi:endonuclease V [Dysgonomonas sp. 511]|uniref:endonuclease V n=1 Tax=Dysgonomonas sp. 511 TaxID=2302930 RepID=UPI0013D50874|nr:endonuclease V [Dysgonomonas sp. 511]NDV78400.1 endonuclease V [Dysgonomonas sp. 511]
MILAFDTYYFDNKAKTVCLAFQNWDEKDKFDVFSETIDNVNDYIPGEFYKRELPCILSLLHKINAADVNIDTIIVDGFIYLDDNNKWGLGGYLHEALNGEIPIIGVAKSNFATIVHNKRELLRGESKRPLYITSIGINLDIATEKIKSMDGKYRMPTLLKELDRLTKDNSEYER